MNVVRPSLEIKTPKTEPPVELSRNASVQSKTVVVVLTALVIGSAAYVLWIARTVILLSFAGVLFAILLSSLCTRAEKWTGLRRRWSLPLVAIAIASVFGLAIWLRGPAIGEQIDQLQEKLPVAIKSATARLSSLEWEKWLVDHGFGTDQLPRAVDLMPGVTNVLRGTLGFLVSIVIVLFLGVAMAAEPHRYRNGFERLFRGEAGSYAGYVLDQIGQALRWWLVARLVSMCAVGAIVTLGLKLLGVPLAGTLGILAALLTFIPNVGPILSAIPPVLLAFSRGPRLAFLVILLFCAVHAIEGFLITPLVERAAVRLPPALTFSMQMLLVLIAGPIGIALAAPLTTVGMVLLRTVYAQKVLGEPISLPPAFQSSKTNHKHP